MAALGRARRGGSERARSSDRAPARKTTVTRLAPQSLRLLVLAAEVNLDLELARLLPDTLPAALLDD
ncbi:hypothetical protein [Streptomyces sp. 3330]|uniref:hypothetical protein n=1 Tax=Streptomyces sp. 3330 TaxID=2817755 RepID=UPI00286B1F63|nr:hypothetical protein [Streptomyces sp. 3330]